VGLAVAYDFDGVLVDSYSCLPIVYRLVADRIGVVGKNVFVESMLYLEDLMDYYGVWDRREWWRFLVRNSGMLAGVDIDSIVDLYWSLRIRYSHVMPNATCVLERLNNMGIDLYIVSGMDDTVEGKIRRIRESGLTRYFRDVIVYGVYGEFKDVRQALSYLVDQCGSRQIYYVDDKIVNLNRLAKLGINLVNYLYRPPYPRAFAWTVEPAGDYMTIYDHLDLVRFLDRVVGSVD